MEEGLEEAVREVTMEDNHKGLNILYKVRTFSSSFTLDPSPRFVYNLNFLLKWLSVGVMRFLQTEWHRHERDRNAWQIERAEMKSRIGKLEGDGRTSKRLQESLGKHVKILENALKREREKAKVAPADEQQEEKKIENEESAQNARSGPKRTHCL